MLHVALGFLLCMRRSSERNRCCAALELSNRLLESADMLQSLPILPPNHEFWTSNHCIARQFRRPLTGLLPKSFDGRASVLASPNVLGFTKIFGLTRPPSNLRKATWTTRVGPPTPNMAGALGDAAWMCCMERNGDTVVMECFAPLFVNVSQLSGPRPLDAMGERPHRLRRAQLRSCGLIS
jgi:hypothetical protein